MTIDHLQEEALKLPRELRARLAEILISSLDEDSEIESAWVREAERRYEEYRAGRGDAVPAEEALARLRSDLST